jgi:hypothetical protein
MTERIPPATTVRVKRIAIACAPYSRRAAMAKGDDYSRVPGYSPRSKRNVSRSPAVAAPAIADLISM